MIDAVNIIINILHRIIIVFFRLKDTSCSARRLLICIINTNIISYVFGNALSVIIIYISIRDTIGSYLGRHCDCTRLRSPVNNIYQINIIIFIIIDALIFPSLLLCCSQRMLTAFRPMPLWVLCQNSQSTTPYIIPKSKSIFFSQISLLFYSSTLNYYCHFPPFSGKFLHLT